MVARPPRALGRVDPAELRALATDLAQLCLDVAGVVDPTPISDGTNALISLGRGNWLDAALSGVAIIPYVGDLAKAGKFPRYLKTIEKAVALADRSADARRLLEPVMRKLDEALRLLPDGSEPIRRLRAAVSRFTRTNPAARAARLIDVSRQFRFRVIQQGDHVIKEAAGRLGVPGKVRTHRSAGSQRAVSGGSGDDAGHLIGNQFGPPGDQRNLSLQNWRQNQGGGTFHDLEKRWSEQLQRGVGVEVKIQDVFRKGESRPFMRRAEWVEIAPNGVRTQRSLLFANADTPRSRAARGVENAMPPGHQATIHRLDDYRR